MSANRLEPWGETRVVGQAIPRIDAHELVSGAAVYTIDMVFPEMLHAAILRCPHANAMVKHVDTSRAEKMPGVRSVITNAAPDTNIPWYEGEKGPSSRLFDPHCRYAGDEVAAVAADTLTQAIDAVHAIKVDYEKLPFVIDQDEAIKPGATPVQPGGNFAVPLSVVERGNIAKGFADAEVVLEQTYRTSCELQSPMEVHGSIAKWEGDHLTVWDTTQGVFGPQQSLAGIFGLPLSSVRVIGHAMGGGFGSKLDLWKHTVIAAILARRTARSVKLFLSREEEFLCVGNRPADKMTLKAGVRKDGTLTALHFINYGVVGAYPGGSGAAFQVMDLYLCTNMRAEEASVHINAGKECPFRAPGFPQCSWALEQTMDALAEKLEMDPIEFRLKNVTAVSQTFGKPYTTTGLKRCLTDGAKSFGWAEARVKKESAGHIRRGIGVAAAMWGYQGEPNATVVVKLFPDGSANLNMGASDIGTGTKTIMAMVLSEELGVPLDKIQVEYADTATTQFAPSSGGSQTAHVSSPAVRAAAVEVKRQLFEIAAAELKWAETELIVRDGRIYPSGSPEKAVPLSQLKTLAQRQVLMAIGTRGPNPVDKVALPFAVQFAEVEVNTLSGEVKVVRFLAAHDSGRILNRLTFENQVFGGITMGIGFGLTEQRRLDRQTGRMVNANFHDYKIPTAMDVPADMTCITIDPHDTEFNTTGVKGIGEPATIPTAAAIANAVYNATGARVTQSPITPMQMIALLADQKRRA